MKRPTDFSRRTVLAGVLAVAGSLTGCSRRQPPTERPIDIMGDQRESGDPLWLPATAAWIIDDSSRTPRTLLALGGYCPYDQRLIGWCTGTNVFVCPLCASAYDRNGAYVSGPSQQGLGRYGVTVSNDGDVIVDPAKFMAGTKVPKLADGAATPSANQPCAGDLVIPKATTNENSGR